MITEEKGNTVKHPLSAVLVALALAGPALAQQAPDKDTVARRLQSVSTLIERSSAAKQIESSADPQALERRSEARALHRQASAAFAGGDLVGAGKLLDEATRAVMAGARMSNPEQVTDEKKKRDFDARAESVKALLAAQKRIAIEKSAGREAQEAAQNVESQMTQAQRLATAGKLDEARPVLDRAYLTAKLSIESMRRGDTLVRSLKFASPREEYDYELDRNDTHRMLVRVLTGDRPGADTQAGIQAALDTAARLRTEAEQLAGRGDHTGAIKVLEESTRALVRGIRGAGIYIPG
jgi:hypothetical protein